MTQHKCFNWIKSTMMINNIITITLNTMQLREENMNGIPQWWCKQQHLRKINNDKNAIEATMTQQQQQQT